MCRIRQLVRPCMLPWDALQLVQSPELPPHSPAPSQGASVFLLVTGPTRLLFVGFAGAGPRPTRFANASTSVRRTTFLCHATPGVFALQVVVVERRGQILPLIEQRPLPGLLPRPGRVSGATYDALAARARTLH